jgi:hypothetical protein
MSVTMSDRRKPSRNLRLDYQRIYAPHTGGIDVKPIKFDMEKASAEFIFMRGGRAACAARLRLGQ